VTIFIFLFEQNIIANVAGVQAPARHRLATAEAFIVPPV